MALVNWGFLHYMDIKKFLKNLFRNRWSDFEVISQESAFDICGPFRAVIATGKLPSTFLTPPGKVKVFNADTGSFWSLNLINKWILNSLRNTKKKKKKKNYRSKNMAFMGNPFSSYGIK